jgi:hypothetical protein
MLSPHLILIIVISLCCLLITLIISLRAYRKNLINVPNNKQSTINKEYNEYKENKEQKPSVLSHKPLTSSIKPLASSLKLPASSHQLSQTQITKILEMTSRFRFFQGQNLHQFEKLLKTQDLRSAEHMIAQKFRAQQKHKPRKLAQEVFRKLLGSA